MDFFTLQEYQTDVLRTMLEGQASLAVPKLRVRGRDEAILFLKGYGYDLTDPMDEERLWSVHRRAVTYIQTQLLEPQEAVPEVIILRDQLKDLANLLIWASAAPSEDPIQRWACGLLRVMHVIVHLTNDLFTFFAEPIQEQILAPIESLIQRLESGAAEVRHPLLSEPISLERFEIKPFKTSNSSITKLLAKSDEVAFSLLDKVGVRFVTKSLLDCFRVVQLLHQSRAVSFAHVIPDQSNNTLYPLNLFQEVMAMGLPRSEIEPVLHRTLEEHADRARFNEKINVFTSREYRFMKLIARQLIRIPRTEGAPLAFFYPFEIQIVDSHTHHRNDSGPGSHFQYKTRQRAKARERVFGF